MNLTLYILYDLYIVNTGKVTDNLDTSNDYRILIVEAALRDLEKIIKNRRLPFSVSREEMLRKIKEIQSKLMVIKYSFLPKEMLVSSQQFIDYLHAVNSLSIDLLPKIERIEYSSNYTIAWIRWILRILMGIKDRLLLTGNFPDNAVDILGVKINSVMQHKTLKNLKVLRASTKNEGFIVVTNIPDIKKGEIRAIAILPPREFNNIVSEAMICSQPLPEKYYGIRPEREKYNFKEVTNMVETILHKA